VFERLRLEGAREREGGFAEMIFEGLAFEWV